MKLILALAALFGASAIMLDAFFAHGLKNYLGDHFSDQIHHALTTASRYQLMASLFLLLLLLLYRSIASPWVITAQVLVCAGVLFFCGSIYLRYLCGFSALAMIAPMGGIAFMLSFLALLPLLMWV